MQIIFVLIYFNPFIICRHWWMQRETLLSVQGLQLQEYMGKLRVQLWWWQYAIHEGAWHLHQWVAGPAFLHRHLILSLRFFLARIFFRWEVRNSFFYLRWLILFLLKDGKKKLFLIIFNFVITQLCSSCLINWLFQKKIAWCSTDLNM